MENKNVQEAHLENTPPCFHSGKVWNLREAVLVMSSSQLETALSDSENDQVEEFLKTTNGKQPMVVHPILPPPTKTYPNRI